MSTNIIPRLYVKSRGEQTTKLALQLTCAPRKCVIRFTGGCGLMSPADANGLYELFAQALVGFDGALLFGGTRMLERRDFATVVPSITEIPPHLRAICTHAVLLGVVPKTQDIGLAEYGMIVSDEGDKPYVTIVHPEQDMALLVQVSADDAEIWDAEYQECLRIVDDLRTYAAFTSITVSYNGGSVTRREILATAAKGWPVILVRGSGRVTDELAADAGFLAEHRHVAVCDATPQSLRQAFADFGAVPKQRLALVERSTG